jgi:hypothetical protein
MSFGVYGTGNTNEGRKSKVDFNALNKYIVETAQLEKPEVLVGVVAGIVDLGLQYREDAELVFTGTAEDEAAAIDDKPATYFKDGLDPDTGKPCRLKCYPQKEIQSVAVAIDFPEIQLDKGQFFGDTSGETKPLRMWLGGNFYNGALGGQVIARPTPMRIGKNTKGQWSFANLHLFFKMAVAAKIIQSDGVFLPQDIDQLVGQAFQFEAQIFMKKGKDGKEYLTEKVTFKSGLGRGQTAPELPTETFIIQFNEKNDEKMLKEIRAHVVNTIKAAKNYEGSPIQKQLEAARSSYSSAVKAEEPQDETPEPEVPVVKASTRTPRVKPALTHEDKEDSPF